MTPTYWSRHKTFPGKGRSIWKRGGFNPAPSGPTITGLSETTGVFGDTLIITGTDLTNTTQVDFNDGGFTAPSFSVDSDTQITVTVPRGAGTGTIVAAGDDGSASSETFTITPSANASFHDVAFSTADTVASLNVTLPTYDDYDLLLLVCTPLDFVGGGTIDVPSGWGEVDAVLNGNAASYGEMDLRVFAAIGHHGQTPAPTIHYVDNRTVAHLSAFIISYTGAHGTGTDTAAHTTYTATTPFADVPTPMNEDFETAIAIWTGYAGSPSTNCKLAGPDTTGWTIRANNGAGNGDTAIADKPYSTAGTLPAETAFGVQNYGFTNTMGFITITIHGA